MVITVRRNRKKVALASAQTDYRFYTATSADYTPMVGNLNLNRIVHLQYVSIDQDQDTTFKWGTQPLLSKDKAEAVQTWGANLLAPLEIDRWSYDEAMHLYVTQADAQNYYFEIIEYEVTSYEGKPSQFIHIMANGQALFVESETTELALRKLESRASKELAAIKQALRMPS